MTTITDIYQNSEKWLRLVTLTDYGGTQLCKEVLHIKECFPYDGAQLYQKLEFYKDKMQYKDQKEIICPSNRITNESKFDISLYTKLIEVIFKSKYKTMISELRKKRNHLHHMAVKDICDSEFETEWSSICDMLQKYGFTENVKDLKNDNLLANEKLQTTLDSIERHFRGNF